MKWFYTEVDTNDARYIGSIVQVSDEKVEQYMPLIEKIRNFHPYTVINHDFTWSMDSNFPTGECCRQDLGEKSPCELYDIDYNTMVDFCNTFHLYGGEYGFNTITRIQEITLGEKLI